MTKARIFKPTKSAMQSGRGKTSLWYLEFEPEGGKGPEPLMGWTYAEDTAGQVRMKFVSLEEAKSYADMHKIQYDVIVPQARKLKPRNYGDNFKYVPPEEKS